MAQQQPAVVIIARHGLRLDAADQSWHLHTPAPYDPPLTYGGWSQCRALGLRIATLLDARERAAAAPEADRTVISHDFAGHRTLADGGSEDRPRKRRRIKHKVVIHSSPFLRCLQTSVAIAAGMAQYKPSIETTGRPRTTSKSLGGSPRIRPLDGHGSMHEPDLAHTVARKVLQQPRHHRKSTLRVDAFLGEWLNPEYYDQILPPPPSPMMVATAKAELLHNDSVDIFTPAMSQTSSSGGSLWSAANATATTIPTTTASRESPLDDWSPVDEAMPTSPTSPTSPTLRRRASQSSAGSTGGRLKSPFKPESTLQPLTSTLPKPETAVYHPPQPHYAVSTSEQIPRGYVSHAKTACTNVDYQWDSSKPPQAWGDGGEFGEEWSSMHKRFRRGLNHLIQWYSRHDADDRGEDEADHRSHPKHLDDDEEEDVVVIMVTHGAGCNALIGALTGQPVLLDVGMASLTMAVRRDDAPPITTYASTTGRIAPSPEQAQPNGPVRRGSLDLGLRSIYDMKLVASSEHLRPGVGSGSPSMRPIDTNKQAFIDNYTRNRLAPQGEPPRSNTSSALGSIRRPSAFNSLPQVAGVPDRSSSLPPGDDSPVTTGLWTPPMARTPNFAPLQPSHLHLAEPMRPGMFTSNSDVTMLPLPSPALPTEGKNVHFDFGTASQSETASDEAQAPESSDGDVATQLPTSSELGLPSPGDTVPTNLSRGMSQQGLWGAKPSGARPERKGREDAKLPPKRRWTLDQE